MTVCVWCESKQAFEGHNRVFWELPDGSRAIQINGTPCISCPVCGMEYQTEEMVDKIEEQLFLIDTKELSSNISFDELMNQERLLKKNYFDFRS
ncbi:YokU family protein [Bacillus carboniphilus]|uniref:YokU family protein n=1 Tax=Bacillus carboniphilus TaxID=86663 RepID=A0ABY9K0E6_9BACI|nr:YokU family protein [Bacillus carboniphilus]WLR43325.1 YokU family protein [Bacillus carboniphilus]